MVSLSGGPLQGFHLIPAVTTPILLKLSTGKWVSYYCPGGPGTCTPFDRSGKTRKDKKPQAAYKFGKEWDEEHQDVQLFIRAWKRDHDGDALTDWLASNTKF